MSHRFLVLHFSGQCPWHSWIIEQARDAATQLDGTVEVIDVMTRPEIAHRYRLFFPNITVIDDTVRLAWPTPADRLVKIAREGIAAKPTILQAPSPQARTEKVEPLTVENIVDTCPLCIPSSETRGCQVKQAWASMLKDKVQEGVLGFIAYEGEKAVGVVEFLPAPLVPYPLPEKEPTIAFITCIYPFEEDGLDYRGQVLDHLIDYLPHQGYKKLQVIAGRRTPYPNGPISFFLSHRFGVSDEVDSIVLKEGEEELVLMERQL